MDTHVLEGTDS